jgi:hypothetical protein
MPHAVATEQQRPLPSLNSWPHGKLDVMHSHIFAPQVQESRAQPAWLRSSLSGPPTPPSEMNGHAALEGPLPRGNHVGQMFQDYNYMQNSQLPPISKPESPNSQRRLSQIVGYDVQSVTSSPQRTNSSSMSLSVPDSVRTPQQDLSELAAEVSLVPK